MTHYDSKTCGKRDWNRTIRQQVRHFGQAGMWNVVLHALGVNYYISSSKFDKEVKKS